MQLPSFLKRKDKPPERRGAPATEDGTAVEAARLRARRRLIGAVVLLGLGVIGFPLVFETQPRPIALDVPIEPPRKLAAAGTERPAAPPPRTTLPVPPPLPDEPRTEAPPAETPAVAAAASAAPAARPAASAAPPRAAASAAAPPRAAAASAAPAPQADDGTRAQALLEASAASQPRSARFVVQVGAYTDAAALREARQKVEKLGLKTYTQVVETDAGKRTRVRVGPFASREEADSAGAKLKSAGLPVAVLTL